MKQTSNKKFPVALDSTKGFKNHLNKYTVGLNHQPCKKTTSQIERFRLSPHSEFQQVNSYR